MRIKRKLYEVCESGHDAPHKYPWLSHIHGGIDYVKFQEPSDKGKFQIYNYKTIKTHCDEIDVSHNTEKLVSSHIKAFINKRTRIAKVLYHFIDGTVREPTIQDFELESNWFDQTSKEGGIYYNPYIFKNYLTTSQVSEINNAQKAPNKKYIIREVNGNKNTVDSMSEQMASISILYDKFLQKNPEHLNSLKESINNKLNLYISSQVDIKQCNGVKLSDIRGFDIYGWCCYDDITCKYQAASKF